MENKRVVITGLSVIAADSLSNEQLWENLNKKHIYVKKIDEKLEQNYKFKSKFYVPFPQFKIEDYGFSSKYNSVMEDNAKIAIICAKNAIEDAGFKIDKSETGNYKITDIQDSGVIIGTGLTSLETSFLSYINHSLNHLNYPEIEKYRYNRMVIPLTMPNSIAAWISIMMGLKGESYTVNTACSSGNYAIGQAFSKIKYGEQKVMISGGVECLKDELSAIKRGFDILGTLTNDENGTPQPFSKNRSGFLFSEGAGSILVLEEFEHAKKRKARIYAEIIDCKFNNDAYNIVQMDEKGIQIKKMINDLIQNNKIDYINTHGTGTCLNDRIETEIIQEIFGDIENQPFVNSTKSMLGHSLGASSAVEAAVTAMSVFKQAIHPNLSENNIENLNIALSPINTKIEYAISCSYGFGGHNSAILFRVC